MGDAARDGIAELAPPKTATAEIFNERSDYKNPSGVASAQAPFAFFLTGTVHSLGLLQTKGLNESCGVGPIPLLTPKRLRKRYPIVRLLGDRSGGKTRISSVFGGFTEA